ncbi:hypothetical protein [Arthrobacter sp. H14-L1]|uniref:hypothetical protein n=1 Tax=Arthrobacter sp. H14-L1 TaxID=2996697 RepID=UPI00226FAA1D|nr:hypothetical protein [Arthrobacter sp. H14-L1]MCY0905738.1 hypothetical protein [Arthrobacter sp. H14-L1]
MESSTFSRRSALGMGVVAALGIAGVSGGRPAAAAPADSGTVRPTGTGYVRYEDLYKPGDTVSAAMARLTQPAIITFPEGRFECSDFGTGYNAGISIPKIAKGIWGSGRGTVGGSTGTIFTIRENTSSKRSLVPAQSSGGTTPTTVMMHSGSTSGATFGQFQVAGTEQGHIFHGFAVYNPGGVVAVTDVLVTGWAGNNGAPPGETFGLTLHGGSNNTLTRVEADGRRAEGGPSFGAVGLTYQDTVGGSMVDCVAHHCVANPVVLFQSFNVITENIKVGRADDNVRGVTAGSGINHERTSGCEHRNPTILTRETRRGVHMTHSNDKFTLTRGGVAHSSANGTLKVVNPTYNDIWGNNKFYIETWSPYWTGNTMTTANPPLVVKSDDKTKVPYKWAFSGKQYNIA